MNAKGIVGFFDIMGYQNIIRNNSVEETAKIVEDIIYKLPAFVEARVKKLFEAHEALLREVESILSNVKVLIVSDSILVISTVDDEIDETELYSHFCVMFVYFAFLVREFFEKGFPLRGAIDYGSIYLHETTFAGDTIVETYNLSSSLEFSGCVLTDRIMRFCYDESIRDNEVIDGFVGKILCSTKNGDVKLSHLDWVTTFTGNVLECDDLRRLIYDKFYMHKKDIETSVVNKINNTESIMRYFYARLST